MKMFIRQHYKAIAEIIKSNNAASAIPEKSKAFDRGVRSAGRWIAGGLADYFASDNPLFDRNKFMKACGLD